MPRKDSAKELRELQAEVQQRLSQVSLLQQEQRELRMQHDALVSFVDLLGWLRDQHTKAKASDEQQQDEEQQQQQQQPSLASLLGNTSELLLLDQLRYLPYSGGDNHATGNGSAAAAAAKPKSRGLQDDEDEEAASNLERRIAPPGDLMYWLRWLLAQPPHPEAHTITAEQLTQRYAKSLPELSILLHQVDNGSGHAPVSGSNGAEAPAEQDADSADAVADPYERMGRILLQHHHLTVSVVLAGRNHVLSAFCLANPETGKSRTEHDMKRYNWALQQIKLTPEQVADTVGVTKVFQRIYAPVAMQLRELQLELGLQQAGTTAGAGAGASSNTFGIYGGRSMADTSSSSSGGSGSSSRVTEAEVQPPSSMLKHLTESDAKAQKLARLGVLLQKDATIKMGVGQLLSGVLEVPQLARLMVLLAYPVNWTTCGLTIYEMHKQRMLELDHPQQQQHHGLRYAKRHQPTVLSKKRVSLVRKKLEVCNISEM